MKLILVTNGADQKQVAAWAPDGAVRLWFAMRSTRSRPSQKVAHDGLVPVHSIRVALITRSVLINTVALAR